MLKLIYIYLRIKQYADLSKIISFILLMSGVKMKKSFVQFIEILFLRRVTTKFSRGLYVMTKIMSLEH
jgi:hypothetical protein